MQSQWIAGASPESQRIRRLGEAFFCLMAGLIVLSVARVILGGMGSRLDWSAQTINLFYIAPLILVLAVNAYTLLRVGDRIVLVCYLLLVISRAVGHAEAVVSAQTMLGRDLRMATSGITSIMMAVIFYRLVQILLITEDKRKQQLLDRIAECTSHRIGANFLDGLVAAVVDVLNIRLAFVSRIDAGTRQEFILAAAATGNEVLPDGLQGGTELIEDEAAWLHQADSESLHRIELVDEEGHVVGCLGLICAASDHISPGQEASLRIFGSRATAEILRVEADRRSSDMEARMLHAQKLESLGVLAGGIAHDFNNLLQAIGGTAAVTGTLLPESSEAHRSNDQIQDVVSKGAGMCHRLLAYAGRAVRQDTVCDINAIVRETTSIVQAARTDCSFSLELSSRPLPVWGDEAQLTQVVINLLTNAADATSGTNCSIRVRTVSGSASCQTAAALQLGQPGDHAFVEVEDNGCGIDPDAALKVFDPFYTTKGSGRGIGLAVVLRIVQDHQGDITLKTQEAHGTTFVVAFPLTTRTVEKSEECVPPTARDTGDRSVLVVDDEDLVRETTQRLLESQGITVTTAASGSESLRHVEEVPRAFDCILMDQTMPGMSGVETCHQLRQNGVATPVILMSGFSTVDIDVQVPRVTFLSKPFTLRDLLAALDEATEYSRRSLAG